MDEQERERLAQLTRIEAKVDRVFWLLSYAVGAAVAAFVDYAVRHLHVPSADQWGVFSFFVTLALVRIIVGIGYPH